ncbi:penicillin-binding protein 2 [Tersicoccus sp. MR15.9]|uniref:peptidoglycan D,D-transpeptidase FtsI family protein n=1 Tax=Tersicoccus mangrovi TaxID=3121635 RepID=UPI002FE6B5C3
MAQAVIGRRLRTGLVMLLALLVVLGGRLFWVQGLDPSGLAQAVTANRTRVIDMPSTRGEIVDANGNVLAKSVQSFNITVDQTLFQDYDRAQDNGAMTHVTRDQAIAQFAGVLKMDPKKVRAAVTGDKRFNYVARNVSPAVRTRIIDLDNPAIYSESNTQRVYPSGAVAGGLVGFMSSDNRALAGLELTQDKQLTGTDGQRKFEIGANGVRIPNATSEDVPAKNGETVKLTINQDIQWVAQQAIANQVAANKAEWGTAVVVEVATGNLIAVADSTTVDPNNPGATPADRRGSLAVSAAYEPGSTTKMITASGLIEEKKATPLSQYLLPPTYTIDGQTFSDSFEHGYERRTLAGILGWSMNTGTVMAGSALTRQQRYDYLKRFGIGQPLNLPLPGTSQGILAPPDQWDGRQQYTVLFGQGVSQTPVHTAMAFQTIANNGIRLQPRLIDAYIDPDGTEHKVPIAPGTRVVSDDTAHQVQQIIEGVITDGGAKDAQLEGYRVGGKTGTSENPGPNGHFDGYTASFVGMAPMENPRYVVGIVLQKPQGNIYGISTAPAFKTIMSQVLNTYKVPPSTGTPPHLPLNY